MCPYVCVSARLPVRPPTCPSVHRSVNRLSVHMTEGRSVTHSFSQSICFSLRTVAMGTSSATARISAFASVYAPLLVSEYLLHRL